MEYDYGKLKGRIVEKFGSQAAFSKAFPLSERTLSQKMTGKKEWSQKQIVRGCELLSIDSQDIPIYFFSSKV